MINFVAGMVALWLVHLATDLAVWVSSPAWGHSVVFLGKMLNSHSASDSTQVCKWVLANSELGITLQWT